MKFIRLSILVIICTLLISTSLSNVIAAEQARTIQLFQKSSLYKSNSIKSANLGTLPPQTLKILEKNKEYYKVKTSKGNYWVHPTDFRDEFGKHRLYVTKMLSLFNGRSYKNQRTDVINPQFVTVLESNKGWLKVSSVKGTGWINLAEKLKVAYITFDDGPSKYTSQILDILKSKKAKATFFAIEPNIRTYKTSMIRVNKEGHYIGLHSVSHSVKKLYKGSYSNVAKEMETTRKTLKSVAGVNHYLVRVPYGSKPYMTKPFRDWLVKYHFKMWDWTIDSNDWRYSTSQYTTIIKNVKSAVPAVERQKKSIIVLMHERPQSVRALPQIIDYLKSKGYVLVPYDPRHHVVSNFWNDSRL